MGETLTVPDLRGQQVSNLKKVLEYKNLNYQISDSSILMRLWHRAPL
jgi:beta-lactam-binding protein with PASTA domain